MSRMPQPKRTEQSVVKPKVRKLLTAHDWFWWVTPANMFGRTGVSDYCAIKAGMFMAIETKYDRRDPTPMQIAFLDSVRACSHFAFVVRDTTLDAFEVFLTQLDVSIAEVAAGKVPTADQGGPMLDAIKRMHDTEILNQIAYERKLKAVTARNPADV